MATLRRYSRQRERIYQAVHASREHPSAQMVYDLLREELPRLSLGTVYRNLHQMAQEGMLQELEGPTARFDACLAPHAHIRWHLLRTGDGPECAGRTRAGPVCGGGRLAGGTIQPDAGRNLSCMCG